MRKEREISICCRNWSQCSGSILIYLKHDSKIYSSLKIQAFERFRNMPISSKRSLQKTLNDFAKVKLGSIETTTHRIPAKRFKPYPAINKPSSHYSNQKMPEIAKKTPQNAEKESKDEITIVEAAKVVEITTEKSKQQPKSFNLADDFFDRYYKNGWKEKDAKGSGSGDIPDFLKFAVPMPASQRRMDIKYIYLS